ncbi:flagellar filament capping protein FliD [Sphingomonas sp. CJ20]
MAIESIAKTLGTGSGIDVGALVTSLVENAFENKNVALTKKGDALTAQISKVSELKSSITDFASALSSLTAGGSLATQPTSSNSSVVAVSRLAGAELSGLSGTLEVRQRAQAQVASSAAFTGGSSATVGTGTLTLTFGTASVTDGTMTDFTAGGGTPVQIDIDSAHATLAGVASAINTAKAGVTASIVTDSAGARLVVKGATGQSQAFELTGSDGLSALDIGRTATGSTISATAQNATVVSDGVTLSYPTNTIYGLFEGVKIDLVSAAVGTKVTIGSTTPTSEISQTVTNFVDTYNELYKSVSAAVSAVDGPLRSDSAAKELLRQLKSLTLTNLVPSAASGEPATLADIGVATQRDGTLKVNATRLSSVLVSNPQQVEAIFAAGAGITQALSAIATTATSTKVGLGASEASYTKAQTALADEKDKVATATEAMRTRMTQQFSAMDAKVAAYKSTQTFLTQQIDAWNANN